MSVVRKILVFTAIAVLALSLVSCDIGDLFGGTKEDGECKHSFGEWVSLSESTCSQAGKQARVCAKCSETEQRDAELKAHTNEAIAGVDATCTEDGLSEGQRCTVCGAVTVEQQTIPAKGHTFENGVCHCGAVEGEGGNEGNTPDEPAVSGELVFELSEDGEFYIVSGIGKYTDGNVVIPSIYKGLPVKGIKAYAFKECESMTSVVIPAGIEVISEGAFYNCTKLERVTVPDGVTAIESYAFYRCVALNGVELPRSVETIGFRAFIYCRKMTTVKALGVVSIDEGAFMDCRELKTILLSDELESIGKKAFADCAALNKIAFSGTRSSWDAVEKAQEWDSNAGEYNVVCSKDDTVQGDPQFVISAASASAGETVEITIKLKNNPGIASMILAVAFDESALTLKEVVYNTKIGGQTVEPQKMTSPVTLYWINGLADAEGDFLFVTLRFTVKSGASKGDHGITLTYKPDNVYDITETNIEFKVVNGKVTVK